MFKEAKSKIPPEKLNEAKEMFNKFTESRKGKLLLSLFDDISEEYTKGIAVMAVNQLALSVMSEIVIDLFRHKYNIPDPKKLVGNPSYKQAMVQEIAEMITPLIEDNIVAVAHQYKEVE